MTETVAKQNDTARTIPKISARLVLEPLARLLNVLEPEGRAQSIVEAGSKPAGPDSSSEEDLRDSTDRLEEILTRMQGSDARRARRAAFDASPEELGEAALAEARRFEF